MLSGEEVDDRGAAPSMMLPDSQSTDQPKTCTKNRTRQSDHASEKLFTFVCAFPTRNLTPELSRGAHVASGGVALAYTASAATKQRRLERIVRLCAGLISRDVPIHKVRVGDTYNNVGGVCVLGS